MAKNKNQKPHAHLHKKAICKISNKSDEIREGSCGARSDGRKNGRNDGRTDRRTHTWTDKGHFFSPPPPTSGDKNLYVVEHMTCKTEYDKPQIGSALFLRATIYLMKFS